MITKFLVINRATMIIPTILCLISFSCLSCSNGNQNKNLLKTPAINNRSNDIQISEPVLTVENFMKLVSENNQEAANNLIVTEQEKAEDLSVRHEMPTKLNWAEVFRERSLSLDKITSSDISNDAAIVKTILVHDNNSRIKLKGNFKLTNINDHWFITDIEFITGKE